MSLNVIIGPMFAGKTSELIRLLTRYSIAKKKVIAIDSKINTRSDELQTHNFHRFPAEKVTKLSDIDVSDYDVIGIDEAQFYDDLFDFCNENLKKDKIIIIAGLNASFEQKMMGQIMDVCTIADKIMLLKAVCMKCGKDAPFSYRKNQSKEIIVVGDSNEYEARCRKCFLE